MKLQALLFDVDGTLVDTNQIHAEAWRRAFARFGYQVDPARILPEIGKGGDKLVPDVLGEDAARRHGDDLHTAHDEELLRLADALHFPVFPGVTLLFDALHERGLRIALATSAKQEHFDALQHSAGIDLGALADVVTTSSDAAESKPDPDIVLAAVDKLGLQPAQCAMVGDTPHDAAACRKSGVLFLGLECGGWDAARLREAGAAGVWRDPLDLLTHLDAALALAEAAPSPIR